MPRVQTLIAVGAFALGVVATPRAQTAQNPAEFVHRAFAHGVPYEEALRFQSADNQRLLLTMLSDPRELPARVNIVSLLGMIGDGVAARALRDFVGSGDGVLIIPDYNAHTAAIFSLGYVLNRLGERDTFDYLQQGTQPARWNDRVHWQSPFSDSIEHRNVELAIAAVRALGISGTAQGEQTLRTLALEGVPLLEPASRSAFLATVREALAANPQVRSLGLPQFLRQQQNRN